jgi:hypothetical protein
VCNISISKTFDTMSRPASQNTASGNFIGDCYIALKCFESRGSSLLVGDVLLNSKLTVEKGATICNGLVIDTLTEKEAGKGVSILSELKVNIINESSLGTGVEIEGVVLKDGMVSVPVTNVVQCIRDMNNDTEVCANDDDTITMDVAGVEKCRISVNGAFQTNSGDATGVDAFASGDSTASGDRSMAGGNSTASGVNSFSVGNGNISGGNSASSLGTGNVVNGGNSFSSGNDNNVSGDSSSASGSGNIVSGNKSRADGTDNTASGDNSLAGGFESMAKSDQSIAWGNQCVSGIMSGMGDNAVSLGNLCQASGHFSFARGDRALGTGDSSFSSGKADAGALLVSMGIASHVMGRSEGTGQMTASGVGSLCNGLSKTGLDNTASGDASFVSGTGCSASAAQSTSLGLSCNSSGLHALCAGESNTASGPNSAAFGNGGNASGESSMTIGVACVAANDAAFAGGTDCVANGPSSFSHGLSNLADAFYSACLGQETTCSPGSLAGFAGGVQSRALSRAQWCRSSGRINVDGDAQTSMYNYSGVSTDAVPFEMFLGIAGERASVPTNHSWSGTLDVVGRAISNNSDYCEKFLICIRNSAGNLSFTQTSLGKLENGIMTGAAVSLSSFMGDDLVINIIPPAVTEVHWAATLIVTQVG